jgi:flagellar biosynthesis/type III secretory pathway M-ring protein FliF/YscJ
LVLTIGLSFGMAVLGLLVQPTVKIVRRQQPQQKPQQQQPQQQKQQQQQQQQQKHNTEFENEDIAFFQFAGFCPHQIPPSIIHLYHQSG